MSDRVSDLYQQQLLSAGLLGGFLIATLVLVLQAQTKYEYQVLHFPKDWYFDGLVTLIALTSLFLIFTSWGMGYVASGLTSEYGEKGRRFRRVILFSNRIGLTLVLSVVSALMVPFSIFGGLLTFFLGAILLIAFDELRLGALREAHQELKEEQAEAQAQSESPA